MRVLAGPRTVSPRATFTLALRAVKRFLLRPAVITGEIVWLTLAGVLGASIPQLGMAPTEDIIALHESGPVLSALVEFFALDHVFQSAWFLGLTLLTAASLSVVVVNQFRRLGHTWSQPVAPEEMRRAPYQTEFERPAASAAPATERAPRIATRTSGRLGLAGSAVFHAGLLVIMVAGALRALFAVDAMVDLLEGETLPATAAAWGAQWPGALAAPLRLEAALTLESVTATRYETGALRDVRGRLTWDSEAGEVRNAEIAINNEVRAPGGRLFLGADFGPAALIEWMQDGAEPVRDAVLLRSLGNGTYQKASYLHGFIKVFLRAEVDGAGQHPETLDVRIVDNASRALLFGGRMRIGDEVALQDGQSLTLHGLPFWTRLRGSRDPALWVAYLGFALALVGAAMMYMVVKVDTCVVVTPEGDRERVFVALRAQRFAPLFQERFEHMVRAQGGVT